MGIGSCAAECSLLFPGRAVLTQPLEVVLTEVDAGAKQMRQWRVGVVECEDV